MAPQVEYDEITEKLIGKLAKACVKIKVDKGARVTRRRSYLSNEDLARNWITALYCVTRYLGLPMDWSVRDGNYTKPHFFLERYSCKVRMSIYKVPILKFDSMKWFPVKLVFLCSKPGERTVALHGCVSFQRFRRESHPTTLTGQEEPCLTMGASEMTPIDRWEEEANWKPKL